MAWDSVPWLIGGDATGGAEHSPEIMRMLSYFIMGGQEGVLGKHDLRVLPLTTPGAGYRVMPGAAGVISRWQSQQEYIGRMAEVTNEEGGPATTSAAGRSDLVVANILDPFAPGSPWDPPADRLHGPYIETTLITDVPPGTTTFNELNITNWSAVALARIDMPPSTSTIEAEMIKDLRVVANPLTGVEPPDVTGVAYSGASKVQTYVRDSGSQTTDTLTYPTNDTYTNWPSAANVQIHVPEWATKMTYDVRVTNLRVGSPDSYLGAFGDSVLEIGGIASEAHNFDFDGAETIHSNETIFLVGEMDIPDWMRGQIWTAKVMARLYNAYHPQAVLLAGDNRTSTIFTLNFRQTPILEG